MLIRLACGALEGVDAFRIDLEVDYSRQGMPSFIMVGLAEGAVREAKERVFSAIRSAGFHLAPARITVNLAPADKRKAGSAYDFPMAMALLAASGALDPAKLCAASGSRYFFAGELSLSGALRPVPGILPLALLARSLGVRAMVVAKENAMEASIVEGLQVYGLSSLAEAAEFINTDDTPEGTRFLPTQFIAAHPMQIAMPDFSEVKGQENAKRAIEIAAAGSHNLLFIGPPGSGKTMLAKRIPSILPKLTFEEALEVTKIYSVSGKHAITGLITERPFRAPHHTISEIALIGGGLYPRPGEVSLAHRGVLFLDELPEFQRSVLEVLRQPLEEGAVTISRSTGTLTYPARCMLVAAMNPCPCGYSTDPRHACTCSRQAKERYRNKLSGPLLDRIDLHVEVPAVPFNDLRQGARGTDSAAMRSRVLSARAIQDRRYNGTGLRTNSDLSGAALEQFCALDKETHSFLGAAVDSLALSARAYTRILRIARTIADLEQSDAIGVPHIAEAIQLRVLDREKS